MIAPALRILLIIPFLLITGCFASFRPVEADFKPKGKTLAVLAGLDYEANVLAAGHLAAALAKYSSYHVIPQKQVMRTLQGQPAEIRGPYRRLYSRTDIDYANTDSGAIRAIQQKLHADYLLVIWTYASTDEGTTHNMQQMNLITQLFEHPESKEVGRGKFAVAAGWTTCCLVPAPDAEDKDEAIREKMDAVAREIAQRTGMMRTGEEKK